MNHLFLVQHTSVLHFSALQQVRHLISLDIRLSREIDVIAMESTYITAHMCDITSQLKFFFGKFLETTDQHLECLALPLDDCLQKISACCANMARISNLIWLLINRGSFEFAQSVDLVLSSRSLFRDVAPILDAKAIIETTVESDCYLA